MIKGRDRRTREPKRRRGEGGGLYCNGPGYKTAGCKAGRAVVKQLREPVHRGSRSRRPAILSFSASHAASHERPDLNDHRMLAPLGFYRPAKPLLLPRVREGSFVLRSSLFLSNRSRSRSAFLVYPNSNIPFFHPTEAPPRPSTRIARQFFLTGIPFYESSCDYFFSIFITLDQRICNRYLYIALTDMHIARSRIKQ